MKGVKNFTEIAFSDEVKSVQKKMGSRKAYSRLEGKPMNTQLEAREVSFIIARDSFYMGSVNSNGFPYVQFRGGPKGFLKVLSSNTLGFMDYGGNRQYISTGNIIENPNVSLFLMDYVNRARLKIWAKAKKLSISELEEKNMLDRMVDPAYQAKHERGFIFNILAFDWNCPKYIPQKYTIEEVNSLLGLSSNKSFQDIKNLIGG